MGPWQDFLAAQPSGSSSRLRARIPSPIEAFRARPLRSLVIVVSALFSLSLLSAAFGGVGSDQLRATADWGGSKYSSWSSAAKQWAPAWALKHNSVKGSARFGGVAEAELRDPIFTRDRDNGLLYPDDINPARMNPVKRASATFVSLVRNSELDSIRFSMHEVETAFNSKFNYPYVFLNDEPFSDEFKRRVRGMTRAEIHFGLIPKEHWGYPDWINQTYAAETRRKMAEDHVIYGDSESYRQFNSGYFWRHPLLDQFDYYWRVEPGVEFYCQVDYDVFQFMQQNNKTYAFTVAIYEKTIESLWPTVREFAKKYPQHIAPDNSLGFLVDDLSQGMDARYNLCHFWSNFEIADLRFWRSQAYRDFFDFLDQTGNFFYERWGDAPVHSIAAALLLPASRLHQADDIGYRHNPWIHCPANIAKYHDTGKCSCDPKSSFDEDGYSCMRKWWAIGGKPA